MLSYYSQLLALPFIVHTILLQLVNKIAIIVLTNYFITTSD